MQGQPPRRKDGQILTTFGFALRTTPKGASLPPGLRRGWLDYFDAFPVHCIVFLAPINFALPREVGGGGGWALQKENQSSNPSRGKNI